MQGSIAASAGGMCHPGKPEETAMKVTGIETLTCDAGWRNYHFVKLTHRQRHRRLERVRRGLRLAGRRRRHRAPDAARGRASPSASTSASMPSSTAPRGRAPAAWWRRPWAPSRTRCSTPRPRRWACPATSCSAARCATASGCTGRTARRGASIIRPGTSPPSPTSTASRRWAREVREKRFTAMKTNIFMYEQGAKNPKGWRPGFGAPFYPELNVDRTVLRNLRMHLEALRDGAGPRRRHAARPQLQRQDRRLSQDPARDRRPRHVLGRDRQLQPRGAGLHPPPEPASDLIVRDAARPARVPALLPRAGDGRRHRRHAVERRVAVDEDRGARRRRTRSTSRRTTSTATCAP